MKKCFKCQIEKKTNEFYKDKTTGDGLNAKCKTCTKNQNIKYKSENIESIKQYYIDNKERESIRIKKWKETNKEKCKIYDKTSYHKIRKYRYKTDIDFTLRLVLRNRFNRVIIDYKGKKHTSVIELSGCSIEFLRQYIESLWKLEMNWQNYGIVWEIDHIIPCSKFDLTKLEEQQKCFHYTNLQPLFKTTKIAKEHGYLFEIGNRDKSNN